MVELAKAVVPVTWRIDPELFVRIQAAAQAQGKSLQAFASEALTKAVEDLAPVVSEEDRAWLDADLGDTLPPYDWGSDGPPAGRPVRYVPGRGLIIEGGRPER